MIKLELFQVSGHCKLNKCEINEIKIHIEHTLDVINRGLSEGRDYYSDGFIQTYLNELSGMRTICSMIGLRVKTLYEEN